MVIMGRVLTLSFSESLNTTKIVVEDSMLRSSKTITLYFHKVTEKLYRDNYSELFFSKKNLANVGST